jgi:hypothetical protein
MKIIYHCFGGAHSSVIAAAIHLNQLSASEKPTPQDILKCAYFDEVPTEKQGVIHYLGKDEEGNDIYNMGCGGAGAIMERALPDILKIYGESADDLYMVDTLGCVNFPMRLGGYISRRLGMVNVGRPLVLKGSITAYPALVDLVAEVKKDIVQKQGQGEAPH